MKPCRHLKSTACAAVLAAACFSLAALAAETPAAMTPQQAQYVRLHQSATAFVNTVNGTVDRYGRFQSVDLGQARDLLAESERAAQRNDFEQASLHARTAYEMLRNSIMEAVARSQDAARQATN